MALASSSNNASSSRTSSAWRAITDTTSRCEIDCKRGNTSCLMRLRWNLSSSLLGSWNTEIPSASHNATVSLRRSCKIGCDGPPCMPDIPRMPAPRNKLTSTVSAWSSAVWPVTTSVGNTAKRASRARASKLLPVSTTTVRDSNFAPSASAISCTICASLADPSRSPWSTCHAITSALCAAANTSSATESAPPDTAQWIVLLLGANVHLVSNSVTSECVRKSFSAAGISPAALLLRVALATVWVFEWRDFGDIANDYVDDCAYASD